MKHEVSRLRDEVEQLRTALESVDDENMRLVEHRDRLLVRVASQARDLHAMGSALRERSTADDRAGADLEALQVRSEEAEELRVAFEELQVVTEELEVANNSLRHANLALDQRVEERTRKLAASEERLSLAISVGGLATWDWDMITGEVTWSDEHFWMLGYKVKGVRPSFEAWLDRLHPGDRDATLAAVNRARTSGEEYSHEFRVVWQEDVVRTCFARGKFYYDSAGAPCRMIGVMEDITDQREVADRLRILVAELQHRTRNLITVVRAVSERTAAGSTSLVDYRARFTDRLDALARVQGLLSKLKTGDRITFDELITEELSGLGVSESSEQVRLEGPRNVQLRSTTIQTFALAIHELATNAMKYGALSRPEGRLSIRWWIEKAEEARLHVEWIETGIDVPAGLATTPQRKGYGRELIERALPYQLKAKVDYKLESDGVRCLISLPTPLREAQNNE